VNKRAISILLLTLTTPWHSSGASSRGSSGCRSIWAS